MIIEGWIVNVIQKAEVEATVKFFPEVLHQEEKKQNLMKMCAGLRVKKIILYISLYDYLVAAYSVAT
jgi:spore maturation protein CgeB